MSAEAKSGLHFEIAHLLLIDVVGYSKLLGDQQIDLLQKLNRAVRGTNQFRFAEASGKLKRIPTGDGMALVFFHSPEEPVQCALEISQALRSHPEIQLRMGAHSGPVNEIIDVDDKSNVAGAGINVAQRVMDCGDAGHILLSKRLADDLSQHSHWRPHLYDLGECEVKHGLKLHIVNLYKDDLGNPQTPKKLQRGWKVPRRLDAGDSGRRFSLFRWSSFSFLTALLLLAAMAITISILFRRASRPIIHVASTPAAGLAPAISPKSIAVLPFENLSDEKENTFFADGVQDEILNDLSRVADLKVISRTSVMQYRSRAQHSLREIAQALGVAHVVEGSVQRIGNRVRVSAQLIDARTDAHLWGERYDRDIADVFAIETELAKQIVSQLKAKLSAEEQTAIEERPTQDFAAYDLYLRAEHLIDAIAFSAQGKESLFEAIRLLDSAVARDPAFLRAYYQIARAHDQVYFLGFDRTPGRLALADSAIQSILHLRSNSGEAHLALAQHLYWGYRDYSRARQELAIARKTLPNEPLAMLLAGYVDRREGRWNESIREMEQGLAVDPRNVFILQQISFSYARLRRYADQAAVLDRVLTILPHDANTLLQRALVDLEWHADLRPLRSAISIATQDPQAGPQVAGHWRLLALCERDPATAKQALAYTSAAGSDEGGVYCPKAWWEGLIARALHDSDGAQAAFLRARPQMDKIVREQIDYAHPLSLLGMIDAGLGRKENAIREGKRATELLPVSKDAFSGPGLIEDLAVIYAWTGEKALACEQLEIVANIPSGVSYGQLRLHPFWDPLRGDPRFEKIVASLAPK